MPDRVITLRTTAELSAIRQAVAAYGQLDAAQQKTARDAITAAQNMARLDAAMGNTAQAAVKLRSALTGAVAIDTRQATAALNQLRRLEQQASGGGLGPALPRTAESFGPQALAQLAGVAYGPQIVAQAGRFAIEAGKSALALRETQNALRTVSGDTKTYENTLALARQQQRLFGGTLQEQIEGLSGLTITARESGASLQKLADLSQRLAIKDPSQGIGGARIALQEALSGDPASLARRYEISRTALAKLRDENASTAEKLAVIDDYLNRIGLTSAAVAGKVDRSALAYRELAAEAENAKNKLGEFVADGFAPAATATAQILRGEATEAVRGFNARLAESYGFTQQQAAVLATGQNAQERYNAAVANYYGVAVLANDALTHANALTRDKGETDDRAAAAATNHTAAVDENRQKMAASAAAAAELAFQQQQLDRDSKAAAIGMLGAGDQAEVLAAKYGIAKDAAQALILAQQALTNRAALQEQRAGERSPGASGTAEAQTQEERRLQQIYRSLDRSEEIRRQGLATARAHTRALESQADAAERLARAEEQRQRAALDAQRLALTDERKRLEEADTAAQARRILTSAETSEAQRARASLTLREIPVEQSIREEEIARRRREAGILGPAPAGAALPTGPVPAGAGGAAQQGTGQTVIVLQVEKRELGRVMLDVLRSGRAQVVAAGG